MYSDEIKSSSLAKYLNGFDYAIIDTCSLMEDSFPEWMDILDNARDYRKQAQPIYVPWQCVQELKKHSKDRTSDSKRIEAKRAIKILRHASWRHILTVTKKDKNENFADNAIFVRVSTDRLHSKILVITQDKKLATDLLSLNTLQSQNGRKLEVMKLAPGGVLVPNKGEDRPVHQDNKKKETQPQPNKAKAPKHPPLFDTILAADARLSSLLNNSNYPAKKLIEDAHQQLRLLQKLSIGQRNALPLHVPEAKLKEIITGETKPAPTPEPKKEEAKPQPEKKPAPTKRLYYGLGTTLEASIRNCADHYGILFRDHLIRYSAQIHGPVDLTDVDLKAIIDFSTPLLIPGEKQEFMYKGIACSVLKDGSKIKFWIDLSPLNIEMVEKSETPEKPKAAKPAPAKKKPAKQEETPAKPEQAAEKPKTKKAAKPAKKEEPKPAEPQPAPAPVPSAKKGKKQPKAATAVEPSETPAKPAEKEAMPAEAKPAEAKPAKKKAAPKKKEQPAPTEVKPAPAPQPKKDQKKKDTPAPAKKKPAKKKKDLAPASDPVAPKAEPKKKAKAPATQHKETKPKPSALEIALQADARLKSVISNPNYPQADKVADIEKQLELVRKLPKEDAAKLTYGIEALKAMLAVMKS